MVCFFFYLRSKRNRKFKHLFQTKPMGENTITHIMKVSVAGTGLKESEKKVYESLCKKNNIQEAEESKDCKFRTYRQYHRPQRYKFPQKSYDNSCSRPNKIMKTPALRKSKYYINTGSFRHHNNCGSTNPSMVASKENKSPPSFSGFKSQKFIHESSYDGVSGTDDDKQSLKNLSKCLSSLAARSVLLISKRQYTS